MKKLLFNNSIQHPRNIANYMLTGLGVVFGVNSFAQNTQVTVADASWTYSDVVHAIPFGVMVFIGLEMLIIIVLAYWIQGIRKNKIGDAISKPSFFEKINATVAIENEQDIMLDHNYDGIRELDNDLPPWWKYGFYFTIVVAFVYFFHYQVFKTGDLQTDEYNKSITAANLAKEEYQKMSANNVTENNVVLLTDKAEIAKGETIFKEACFACHGKLGEGGVGPNLTDDYWIHGGGIKDIFKTIKYGFPDKGMKSWQTDFSPVQISEMTSYIKILRGSNPANPKAPQGDLFTEETKDAENLLKTDSMSVSKK